MNLSKKSIVTAAILALSASTAVAGGLDRTTYSPNILFEQGNYIEGSWARVDPDLSGDVFFPGVMMIPAVNGVSDIAPAYTLTGFAAKFDINDRIAVAFQTFQNVGYDIDYKGPPNFYFPLEAHIDGRAYVGTAKFNVTDRFSVFGGVKYVVAGGDAVALYGFPGETWEFEDGHGMGYIAGVAYQIPDIALRVSLTYESAFDFDLDTTRTFVGSINGTTTARIPEAWELYFQTGIAPGTLLFGSVRHTSWSDAQLVLFDNNVPAFGGGSNAITDFSDIMTYNIGIGKQLTESLSGSLSVTFEPSDGKPSTLQPTGDKLTLGAGVKVKLTENVEWSLGASYTWLGDNRTNLPAPLVNAKFDGSNAIAWGTKIGLRF
ncbi:MAG: hypothetical protein KDJ80_08955 [Nitratireductor sp.]|nr:hypothetical protein [Nitratireductor sp.]